MSCTGSSGSWLRTSSPPPPCGRWALPRLCSYYLVLCTYYMHLLCAYYVLTVPRRVAALRAAVLRRRGPQQVRRTLTLTTAPNPDHPNRRTLTTAG